LNDPNTLKGKARVSFPAAVQIVKKRYLLKKTGAFPGQRAGDGFTITFSRDNSDPADTCSNTAYVREIAVKYPRQ
jgi:hypothetical protein